PPRFFLMIRRPRIYTLGVIGGLVIFFILVCFFCVVVVLFVCDGGFGVGGAFLFYVGVWGV
ncbi:hypothetical protein, partial [Enterobacter asburiae]